MSRIGIAVTLLLSPLLATACASAVSKVPVRGSESAIARLAGEWEGEYSSEETGRSGSVVFQLRSGADTAVGDVVMTPRGGTRPIVPLAVESQPNAARGPTPQLLTIRFVQVAGDEVHGALDPYHDPDCGCMLTTTFRGVLSGDVIEGTFETEGSGIRDPRQHGRWAVVRVR